MPRSSLYALAALLCAALALPSVAAAKTAPQSCTATSNSVVGGKVVGKLTSSNVDPVQAEFATCEHAKKVMKRTTELGVDAPRPVRAFYCRPDMSAQSVRVVSYVCTFRGADTATFIKLTFKVTYKPNVY